MATDKFGEPINAGDTVEFVYGGDYHAGVVEKLGGPEGGPQLVHVAITAIVPDGTTNVTKRAEKPEKKSTTPSKTATAEKGTK